MAIDWIYDDGGKSNYTHKNLPGDCFCRAVAIASGIDYIEVAKVISHFASKERVSAKRLKRYKSAKSATSSASGGVWKATGDRVLRHLGFEKVYWMKIGSGCEVHVKASELPMGRLVLFLSHHYAAVVDRVLRDNHNCSRGGSRCVYAIWRYKS